MSNSQFEASEKLTGLAFGSSYQKAPLSTLFDHVKEDAICLDQTERLRQTVTHCAHEANLKTKEGKPPLAPPASGTPPSDSKHFIWKDGKQHATYLIALYVFKKMMVNERKAELICLKAAGGYQANERSATTVFSANTVATSALPASVTGTPASMTISYCDAAHSGVTPSVISNQSGYPWTLQVLPQSAGQQLAGGTTNIIYQILSSNQSVPPAVSYCWYPTYPGRFFQH
jgi:hypothetical protein